MNQQQRGYIHHDNASAPGVVPVHQAYGVEVEAKQTVNQAVEGVAHATWSTAPYKNPNTKRCTVDGCTGWATKKWPGMCAGHGYRSSRGDAE